ADNHRPWCPSLRWPSITFLKLVEFGKVLVKFSSPAQEPVSILTTIVYASQVAHRTLLATPIQLVPSNPPAQFGKSSSTPALLDQARFPNACKRPGTLQATSYGARLALAAASFPSSSALATSIRHG